LRITGTSEVDQAVTLTRTNVTIPSDLLAEVDKLAGPRGRSAFVADAVADGVKRERLRRALDQTRGVLVGRPGYITPDESYRWVREQREIDDDRDDE
jgi:metal-responsive CopG/Arc/MetJ family transcriptional regulator